jgi:hypothetical protein
VAAAALSGAGAASASADVQRPFDLYTSHVKTRGQAHVWGSVTYFNRGRTVQISGKINDVCPDDGYGAYVNFEIYVGGSYPWDTIASAKDVRGCKAGGFVEFSQQVNAPVGYGPFETVRVHLYELNQPPSNQPYFGDENVFSVTRR